MAIISSIISWALKKRIHQIELFQKYPLEVQQEVFQKLIHTAKSTEWGQKYDYKSIKSYQDYRERVPTQTYEALFPMLDRVIKGEQNILWPSKIERFSKSSGTTNARSKFIPVSQESLEECHFKAGKDMLSIYFNNYDAGDLFGGKMIPIGGTLATNPKNPDTIVGDVSAIITNNMPFWVQWTRAISLKTALMDEWEEKIENIIKESINEDVTTLGGVPTWTLVLLKKMLEKTGKDSILDIWPNLEVFIHGAVSFDPYRAQFKELIGSREINYLETYNASEGFFGIQEHPGSSELLLMLDYGIFYEFIPAEEWSKEHPKTITLEEVKLGKNYAMIISTNAGLWRYNIGDTIKFTSLNPFRIKITGRTKHFINAFGEELVIENAETGITEAAEKTNSIVTNFTAAPIYFEGKESGGHEWVIEFERAPTDIEKFTYFLDKKMRELNSDYDAKRYKDMALKTPKIHIAPVGTFYNWMQKRGKLGGQNKVPRLSNDREYLEDILEFINGLSYL